MPYLHMNKEMMERAGSKCMCIFYGSELKTILLRFFIDKSMYLFYRQ